MVMMLSPHSLSLSLALFFSCMPHVLSHPSTMTRASCTISSVDDVSTVVASCTAITVSAFTVPANTLFDLSDLADGTKVTLAGDIKFAKSSGFEGPMFQIDGKGITFDGAGHTFDGNGAVYWDTKGSNGGVTKPQFLKVKMSGTFKNLKVLNSPRHVFSVGNKAALTITGCTIDDSAGNELSGGKALGHNTDCFDVSASDVTISSMYFPGTIFFRTYGIAENICKNQDDCLAVNSGSNIVFSDNTCSGGHGISIGSIASNKVVSNVKISGNKVTDSTNGLRIKTVYDATGGSVTGVTYTDNTVTSTEYGVVIEQDYENGSPTGEATDGIPIADVSFTGTNTVSASDDGLQVYVLCGSGSCKGTWDWSGLTTSGGSTGSISGNPPIEHYSL
ncbi:glycoside hydrolase [Mycena vulgaris]|nr:glycoside hydrolase [Mycena vulgaris]